MVWLSKSFHPQSKFSQLNGVQLTTHYFSIKTEWKGEKKAFFPSTRKERNRCATTEPCPWPGVRAAPDLGFGLLLFCSFLSPACCAAVSCSGSIFPQTLGKVPILCPGVTQHPSSHYRGNSIPGCQDTSTWKPRGLSTRKLHLSLETKSKEPTGGGGGGRSGQQGPARALRAEDT